MPFLTKVGSAAARAYGLLSAAVAAANDVYFYLVAMLLPGTGTNGAQNNTFLDSSSNNFTVTRNGNTTQGSFSPFSQTGWSNYFDGSGDFLTLVDNTALQFTTRVGTIECWVFLQTAVAADFVGILDKWVSPPNVGYMLDYSSGANRGKVRFSAGNATPITSASVISVGVWTHIAVGMDGTNATLYINGVSQGSVNISAQDVSASGTGLAINGDGASTLTSGNQYISNLRIVKGTNLYPSAFTPPTAPLTPVANTSLLMCNSQSFVDTGPYNFTITVNGNPAVTANEPFAPSVFTPTSYSGWFDGTGDSLSLTATSALTLPTSTTPFTVEVWVYPTASGGVILAEEYLGGANPVNLGLWLGATGQTTAPSTTGMRPSVGFYGGGATWSIVYSNVDISLNAWTHIAAVFTGSATRIYVNGVDQSVNTITTWTTAAASRYFIAKRWDNNATEFFTGLISNLRWVIGTAVYTSNFTPPTAPLTAISGTALLTCQNPTFIDNSTNAFALTVNGNTQPRTLNPFGYTTTQPVAWSATTNGGSGYFDGTGDYLAVSSLFNLTGDFTIEAWVYPQALNGMILGNLGTNTFADYLQLLPTGLSLGKQTGSIYQTYTSPFTITTGQWHHIALVRSGTTVSSFFNGALGTVQTFSSAWFNLGSSAVGTYFNVTASYTGYMAGLRIVSGTALYSSAFAPPVAPPTNVTNTRYLLNYTNAGIYDAASQNALETVGNAQISTAQSKWGGGSMFFDGTGDYLIPSNTLPLTLGTGDFTIEFWVYFTAGATASRGLIDWRPASTEGVYPAILTNASSAIIFYVNSVTRITGGTPSAATWTHIAVCRSGTSTRLFIDGTQSGSTYTDSNNYLGPASRPMIGATGFSAGANAFNGYMDDLRITRFARYTANFTPPAAAFPTQ